VIEGSNHLDTGADHVVTLALANPRAGELTMIKRRAVGDTHNAALRNLGQQTATTDPHSAWYDLMLTEHELIHDGQHPALTKTGVPTTLSLWTGRDSTVQVRKSASWTPRFQSITITERTGGSLAAAVSGRGPDPSGAMARSSATFSRFVDACMIRGN
jgi:hypothetical protein